MFKHFIFIYFLIIVTNARFPEIERVHCGPTPSIINSCVDYPVFVKPEALVSCSNLPTECDMVTCLFRESEWFDGDKINKEKMKDFYDEFAKKNLEWNAAVYQAKRACLTYDLPAQGVHLNCPAYDVLHCIFISFIRNASPSQWALTSTCSYLQIFARVCPICPPACFAPMVPYGSCNACLSLTA